MALCCCQQTLLYFTMNLSILKLTFASGSDSGVVVTALHCYILRHVTILNAKETNCLHFMSFDVFVKQWRTSE